MEHPILRLQFWPIFCSFKRYFLFYLMGIPHSWWHNTLRRLIFRVDLLLRMQVLTFVIFCVDLFSRWWKNSYFPVNNGRRFGVFFVDFEYISQLFLVFSLLLTLNKYMLAWLILIIVYTTKVFYILPYIKSTDVSGTRKKIYIYIYTYIFIYIYIYIHTYIYTYNGWLLLSINFTANCQLVRA